ncbi:MAG TPA: hypothetical protein PLL44_01940, partial [Novosphingobium sp.]|nr:hypothetical protein [Novosphingobium sp.]
MSQPGAAPRGRRAEQALVGAAVAVSLGLLWLVTRDPVLVAAFAGGVAVVGALAWSLGRPREQAREPEFALPDWSVTVAAIDRGDLA